MARLVEGVWPGYVACYVGVAYNVDCEACYVACEACYVACCGGGFCCVGVAYFGGVACCGGCGL